MGSLLKDLCTTGGEGDEWLLKNLLSFLKNLSLDQGINPHVPHHLFLVCPVTIPEIFVQTQPYDYWQLFRWPPQNKWNKIQVHVSLVLF